MDYWTFRGDQALTVEKILNETAQPTEFEVGIMLKLSTNVCIIGIVSNVLSLTFFFFNWSNKLGEKLLILLNILDLLVCSSAPFNVIFNELLDIGDHHRYLERLVDAIYFISLDCTGFITMLLTVVRSLATYYPFYKPKHRYVAMTFCAFVIYVSAKEFYSTDESYNISLCTTLSLNIVVVLTANIFTIRKLLMSGTLSSAARKNRHATITILILSAFFCFLNSLYVVVIINYLLRHETISVMFRESVARISIPMNSAINPFVYFVRKREMRRFMCKCTCCPSNIRQRNVAHQLPHSLTNFPPPSNNHSNRLGCPTVEVKTNVSIKPK